MNRNPCYCDELDSYFREEHGIPKGFCGICDICSEPGHTQHFPGAVSYTGSWCDNCFSRLRKKQRIKTSIILSLIIIGVITYYVL